VALIAHGSASSVDITAVGNAELNELEHSGTATHGSVTVLRLQRRAAAFRPDAPDQV
jgi:hypothetical protein